MRQLAMDAFVEGMRPAEVEAIPVSFDPAASEVDRAIERATVLARPGDLRVVFTQSRGPINAGQRRLAAAAGSAFGPRTIGVAALSPHDAAAFPAAFSAVFASLGGEAPRLRALARVLRGELSATQGLPIGIERAKT
jgi:hypothetical protein